MTRRGWRVALAIGVAGLTGAAWLIWATDLPAMMRDPDRLHEWVDGLGWWGPAALMGLMALAIVASPLPSAPIALAAGAAYGHLWGTLYVVAGAVAGATTAFFIARWLGRDYVERRFGARMTSGLMGSQNRLMAIVFGLRLLPFISFDVISYAAGVTSLETWRFLVATLAGVTPISLLLTHFGETLTGGELGNIGLAILGLGLLTGASALWPSISRWRGKR